METVTFAASLADILLALLYALRVELAFIAVFGLLWLAGRSLPSAAPKARKDSARSRPVQRREPQSKAPREKPATRSCSALPEEPEKLRNPSWLVPEVVQLCSSHVQQALELYQSAVAAGLDIKVMPVANANELFTALITCAIRASLPLDAIRLVSELQMGPGCCPALITSMVKLCTSKQMFKECLAIYDIVASGTYEIQDKSVWSCLLFCAVEAKSFHRCKAFFEKLLAFGEASTKDYGNMVRFASASGDWKLSLKIVQDMRQASVEIDNVVYNTVLATCVSAEQLDQASQLLKEMSGGIADVITYNTLAKGFVKAGRMDQCMEVYELMRQHGIVASQVTYGIMLDGHINTNQVSKAAEIFETMKMEGCQMNTVLYTTLIKGFARAGQLDQAVEIYEQMRTERGAHPDLITFAVLIKANCDAGRLDSACALLGSMKELSLLPDEVVYNNLLSGCVKQGDVSRGQAIYQDMLASSVRPSNATFSIMIQLYAQAKLFDEAVDSLRKEPAAHGVKAEPRLYSQLALCCLRVRQGRRAVEVHGMMLENSLATSQVHHTLLQMCVRLNMVDTATEILGAAVKAGAPVDSADAAEIFSAASKRKKTACAEVCREAMAKLAQGQ